MGACDLRLRQFVQPERQALGQTAAVDEDQRRAMRPYQVEDGRVDGRPDRLAVAAVARHRQRVVQRRRVGIGKVGHVVDRHDDLEVQLLALTGIDDRHRPWHP